jgi:hypothetical protein
VIAMPTLAQAEAALVGPAPAARAGLVGGLLAQVGYDATGASPVASLAVAISQALLACGVTPADVAAPADADLARLPAASWPKFLDVAALLLMETAALGTAGKLKTIQMQDYRKDYFGPADIAGLLKDRRELVRLRWGYGAGSLTAGTLQVRAPNCVRED